MNPTRETYYRWLFLIAAIYDLVLGVVFTFFSAPVFRLLGISDKLPSFGGYISLLGAFVFVIGVAYYLIFRGDLAKNQDLIFIGALYKLSYCLVAFYYFAFREVPHILFVGVFGVLDLVFLVLMTECLLFLRKAIQPVASASKT